MEQFTKNRLAGDCMTKWQSDVVRHENILWKN